MLPDNDFIEQIENEFLNLLIELLEKGVIDESYAKQTTQSFLNLYPFDSLENLKDKLNNFVSNNKEFLPFYTTYLHQEELYKTKDVLVKMRSFLKQNKIDEALQVAK
ncbi:hypothetical protein A2767_04085 [Candidatus Roizmanbacteria bacterium RIFCSPHIGHO2_01_FULL_35_10]|uniref:Uncharacterized protein n=1 Tax=Candidatus Roizmanbacteria bacterium RIFCSPLOWO2_01_FULL_35_13 TaxID=1802055 RepID=A0A1F7IH43_9BACT|nr:MAG: hypothetical protein A2767_04085 [Candidatus Roizmanbacteria bacterium RIFCSPHIGHO2_01_FULL_35_10]OGK42680.1 MAG: hypothetical protein A3A74_00030 [Candidatus Roizmanbacteria bacterium RIFCSPLOWO2_01_FULL_35_13]